MDRKTLLQKLDLSSFIAFDFETTGLFPEKDRIIEIAAIRFVDGEPTDRFVTLVNPGQIISDSITDITGISNKMVAQAPKETDVVDDFLKFLGNSPLVAHNISFDISFLEALRNRFDYPQVDHILYDTLQLSRSILFDRPAFNLGSVAEFFNFSSSGSHRAETDTENGGKIFIRLVEETASYPLSVISKVLALVKSVNLANKSLFVNLANELTQRGDIKSGLTSSTVHHTKNSNVFRVDGNMEINTISVQDVFGNEGYLRGTMNQYEERKDQIRYSQFVEEIISGIPRVGVVEAGTGLGKSMAYLFPALKRTLLSKDDGPTIISCYTKNLQDQLFYKDLPMLAEALNVPIQAVKLKGRNNYICKTRLDWVIADAGNLLSSNEIASLIPILIWLYWTETGDLSECNGFWSSRPGRVVYMIQSESGFCTTNLCAKNYGCYFGKLRHVIYDAQVIIVNHALLLSEIYAPGFLPSYNTVIIDEAHNLVSTAYNQLSLKLDQYAIMSLLQYVDPAYQGNVRWSNVLKGLGSIHPEFVRLYKKLGESTRNALAAVQAFFEALSLQFSSRYSPEDAYKKKVIIENLTEEFGIVHQDLHWLVTALTDLAETTQRIGKELLSKDSGRQDYPDLHQAIEQRLEILNNLLKNVLVLTSNQNQDWVYWQEGEYKRSGNRVERLIISLHGAPVDVAELLSSQFFENLDYCVLTSATLQVDGSFDYYLNRTGLNRLETDRVKTQVYPSPFYYEDQVIYLQYGGNISVTNDPSYIANVIYYAHKKHNNRILALFTSHRNLNGTYKELRAKPEGRDLPIFAQVYGTSRYAMINGMHNTSNGILLGTNAFWEGIDLPRELLETLIITKLPFDVPSEPIVRAYSKMINQAGGSSFFDYTIPECVIKFRQGFGRLIRTAYDQGTFIVLDDRIVTKGYGRHFSDAIPVSQQIFTHINDLSY